MMRGDGGSTKQRYVILSFRIRSMDSTVTGVMFPLLSFIIRRWIQITFSSVAVPQWPFENMPSLMCLLIPRSAINTLGRIKHPRVLGLVKLSPLPPLCRLPLAGSLPIHPRSLLLRAIPAIHILLPSLRPPQTSPSGLVLAPPTRPCPNPNTPTRRIGKRVRPTYKPPGSLPAPNQGPPVRMIQR
jgi:hypothetical protein